MKQILFYLLASNGLLQTSIAFFGSAENIGFGFKKGLAMFKKSVFILSSLIILSALPSHGFADELIGEYNAYIGEDDLYNSNGQRLTQPWQIIRQDRANFYKFGISQDGDEADPFFASQANREAAESMIREGTMTRDARRMLLRGDVMIHVEIYGRGDVGDYLNITVD